MLFDRLHTDRLTIRRLTVADAPRFVEYRNDEDTAEMQSWPVPFSTEQALATAHALAGEDPGQPGSWFQFAIADRHTEQLLGDIGLHTPGDPGELWTVGYTLHPDCRGKGIAVEAVGAVLQFTCARLGVDQVHASTLVDNIASLRVLHRLGFVATGQVDEREGTPDPVFAWSAGTERPEQRIGLLTGGKSTRMGADKATTTVGDQTMAVRVAAACAQTGIPTIVLGPDDAGTGLPHLRDGPGVQPGPLAGLTTLLADDPSVEAILVATDQPFVRAATLLQLAMQPPADVIVPMDGGHPQVTCARYAPGVLYALQRSGGAQRLRDLFALARTRLIEPEAWAVWGEDGRSFRSLDRPEDIDAALGDYPDEQRPRPQ